VAVLGAGLEENLRRLFAQVQSGAYRALPVRRQYIPKPDGKQRPLGIAAPEDKIVQRAVVEVLNAIYEEDFLGFSYGFRPGRSQHDALATAITHTPVNWILDAVIRSIFDSVCQSWLVRFMEHRIGDQRIICGRSRRGAFQLQRKTRGDRMQAKLKQIKEALRKRMHEPIPVQGHWLRQVVRGYFAYHAVPSNSRTLGAFRHHVTDLWRRTLRRRSQKDAMTWERMRRIANAWLLPPRILHPWPDRRFAVKHPR
jgi:hypothetical protein